MKATGTSSSDTIGDKSVYNTWCYIEKAATRVVRVIIFIKIRMLLGVLALSGDISSGNSVN